MKQGHGDRAAEPKPLHELLREAGLDQHNEAEVEYGGEQGTEYDEPLYQDAQQEDLQTTAANYSLQWRQWAVPVAAASFGSTGARTNEELVDRARAILTYITNG